MDDDFLSKLLKTYAYLTQRDSADHPAVNCPVDRWIEFATALREEHGFDLLADLAGHGSATLGPCMLDELRGTETFGEVYDGYLTAPLEPVVVHTISGWSDLDCILNNRLDVEQIRALGVAEANELRHGWCLDNISNVAP